LVFSIRFCFYKQGMVSLGEVIKFFFGEDCGWSLNFNYRADQGDFSDKCICLGLTAGFFYFPAALFHIVGVFGRLVEILV